MMMQNPQRFVNGMAMAILETYKEVIKPAWPYKQTRLGPLKDQLADRVHE